MADWNLPQFLDIQGGRISRVHAVNVASNCMKDTVYLVQITEDIAVRDAGNYIEILCWMRPLERYGKLGRTVTSYSLRL